MLKLTNPTSSESTSEIKQGYDSYWFPPLSSLILNALMLCIELHHRIRAKSRNFWQYISLEPVRIIDDNFLINPTVLHAYLLVHEAVCL